MQTYKELITDSNHRTFPDHPSSAPAQILTWLPVDVRFPVQHPWPRSIWNIPDFRDPILSSTLRSIALTLIHIKFIGDKFLKDLSPFKLGSNEDESWLSRIVTGTFQVLDEQNKGLIFVPTMF
jgi:hypothetical protein